MCRLGSKILSSTRTISITIPVILDFLILNKIDPQMTLNYSAKIIEGGQRGPSIPRGNLGMEFF